MARKSRSKKRYNKKRKYAKRSYKRSYPNLPLTGFGNKKIARLRYADEITINPVSGTLGYYIFSANGMFDPNLSASGHQPMGFDQHAALFDQYTVIASKCVVTYIPTTNTDLAPAYFDVILSDNALTAASFTSPLAFIESKWAKGDKMMYAGQAGNYNGISPRRVCKFNAKKFFGVKSIVGQSEYQGNNAGNPVEGAFFEVICSAIGGNDPGTLSFLVVIDYIAVFTEQRTIGMS